VIARHVLRAAVKARNLQRLARYIGLRGVARMRIGELRATVFEAIK
jgi:hypothetical protein